MKLIVRSKPTTNGLGSGGDGGRLLLFWAIFLIASSDGDGLCIPREREALLSFKRGLTDPSNRLSSWAEDGDPADCCHWRGVICHNSTGHVLQLRLGCNGSTCWETKSMLGGKLSPSLLDLKQLTHLDLSSINFGGIPIPRFLGSLQSLTYLNLSHGWFGGMIPQQLGNLSNLHSLDLRTSYGFSKLRSDRLGWVTGLSKLQYLDLSGVNMSEARDLFPATNNTLRSLKQLRLSSCQIISSPIAIPPTTLLAPKNFSHLSLLDLSGNSFSRVPEWVFCLPGLTSLDLSWNNISGPIPVGLANLSRLTTLDLSWNNLNSSIPEWLFHLNKLQVLRLRWNSLEGVISSAIAIPPTTLLTPDVSHLSLLDLSRNSFSRVPEWVFSLPGLTSLDLSHNLLSGPIPVGLANLTRLTILQLSDNSFNSSVPEWLFHLNKLQVLRLGWNSLEGVIPDGIGNMTALSALDLSSNSLHGPIPESIGRLSSLESLYLSNNQLNGTLPESLGQLTRLEDLSLDDNQLTGDVTQAHFSNLTKLTSLSASRNKLSLKVGPNWVPPFQIEDLYLDSWQIGPRFPQWLHSQKYLSFLQLSGVGISSAIPDWFPKSSPHCYYYNLSHNQIYGDISQFVQSDFDISQFVQIDLGSNRLGGPLPPISPLWRLDLSNNHFSGSISHFLCHKPSEPNPLAFLDLGKNNLSGEISDCWMNWRELVFINFEYNEFTGQIPSSIQYLGNLQSLHLRNNHLQGKLTTSLSNCTSLVVVDLAGNDLSGSIPPWMGERFTSMTFLSLRSNRFVGKIPHQLCALTSLQVLDLAHNNLSGSIPTCFNNFTAMTINTNSSEILIPSLTGELTLIDHAFIATKDRIDEYNTILGLMTCVDLSNNLLSGEIPKELTNLTSLRSLNLSYNRLIGRIPETLEAMKVLESIDFSTNQLFGVIPSSISDLTSISHFNVSNNNLEGKIPLSTQLQSLNASSFSGNKLCGPPLNDDCSRAPFDDEIEHENRGKEEEVELFYANIVIGFIIGFWFVWAPLLFKKSWKQSYFKSLDIVATDHCSV